MREQHPQLIHIESMLQESLLRIENDLPTERDPIVISLFLTLVKELVDWVDKDTSLKVHADTKTLNNKLKEAILETLNFYEAEESRELLLYMPTYFFVELHNLNISHSVIHKRVQNYNELMRKYAHAIDSTSKLFLYVYHFEFENTKKAIEQQLESTRKLSDADIKIYESYLDKVYNIFKDAFCSLIDPDNSMLIEINNNHAGDYIKLLKQSEIALNELKIKLFEQLRLAHQAYINTNSGISQKARADRYQATYANYLPILTKWQDTQIKLFELHNSFLKELWLQCPINLELLNNTPSAHFISEIKNISAKLKLDYNNLTDAQKITVINSYCEETLKNYKVQQANWDQYAPNEKKQPPKPLTTADIQDQKVTTTTTVKPFTEEELEEDSKKGRKPGYSKGRRNPKSFKAKGFIKNNNATGRSSTSSTSSTNQVVQDYGQTTSTASNSDELLLNNATYHFVHGDFKKAEASADAVIAVARKNRSWSVILRAYDAKIAWYYTIIEKTRAKLITYEELKAMKPYIRRNKAQYLIKKIEELSAHMRKCLSTIKDCDKEFTEIINFAKNDNGETLDAINELKNEISKLKNLINDLDIYFQEQEEKRKVGAEFMRINFPDIYFNGNRTSPYVTIGIESNDCMNQCRLATHGLTLVETKCASKAEKIKTQECEFNQNSLINAIKVLLGNIFNSTGKMDKNFKIIYTLYNAANSPTLLVKDSEIYGKLLGNNLCDTQGKLYRVVSNYITSSVTKTSVTGYGLKQEEFSYNGRVIIGNI